MAIAHRGTGSIIGLINSGSVSLPGAAVATDMMILLVAGKPFDSAVTVADWNPLSTFSDGTTAAGNDVGSMMVTAWWKEHDGSESDPTMTEGTPAWNIMSGIIFAFSKGAGEVWDTPVIVGGGDASAGTGFSVTCNADPGVTAGDHCISFCAFRSDAATPLSVHAVPTQTGVTFTNTHDPATDPETTTGGDMGMCIHRSTVTGTGSAAPVIAGTLAASHTGSAGFIRLRVSTPAAPIPIVITAPYIPGGWNRV